MGSLIEINDTLKLRRYSGFPSPVVVGKRYPFQLEGRRLLHLAPTRVFLVEEIGTQWNFVGRAQVVELTIDAVQNITRGIFEVVNLYPAEVVPVMNEHEAPPGRGYRPEYATAGGTPKRVE